MSSPKEDPQYCWNSSDKEDVEIENENDTPSFFTEKVFTSREDLIDWVHDVGRSLGYVIVIKRSKSSKVFFACDRGGTYSSNKISSRNTGTKKINCPFGLVGNYFEGYECWMLTVTCDAHNHDPISFMEGHPYPRRLSENESRLVEDLSRKNVKPRDILSTLKKFDPDNVSTSITVYNAIYKIRLSDNAGRTQMQKVMSFLREKGYFFQYRTNDLNNELEDLFFAHPRSLEIWNAFPHVMLLDATYKTNRFGMPLLEIVGVTSTNMTFCIAFVFMHKEKESNYTWALNCLKSTIQGCIWPRVIVTDRELASLKACNIVFPDAKQLLCRWHIYQNILKRCRPSITSSKSWDTFYKAWTTLIYSETHEAYKFNFERLEAILLDYPGVIRYLNEVWLTPYKQMFVSAWTDRFFNFGNHTTNRVESQHAKLKLYLGSSKGELIDCLLEIHDLVQSQDTSIKASLQQSRSVIKHRLNVPQFEELRGFVSIYALDIIKKELDRSGVVGLLSENCGCQMRTCYGLPCAHEQSIYSKECRPIPLDSIDMFWKKLDLSPCISQEDGPYCEEEVDMSKEQFNNKARTGRSSFLKKLKDIFVPSTTFVGEPAFHKNTRGRPSLKDKQFRKVKVEPPPPTQEPRRHSCSNAQKFVRSDDLEYQQPARHSSYYSHPYINQFPKLLHRYITHIQDVRPDGNCGFRAIAVCLGLHEDAWPNIRYNLIEELGAYKTEYIELFGSHEVWLQVYNSLYFFRSDTFAPNENWISFPEMGHLIASSYNVILHVLANAGSSTYLPLRSTSPPDDQHVVCAIGHVNGCHYVRVTLEEEYPVPPVTPSWFHFSHTCAASWITPYMSRINVYTQYLRSTGTREHVILE